MGDVLLQLKTDSSLIKALEKASAEKQSEEELLEQRVSFIFGTLDSDSEMTREVIRKILVKQRGHTDQAA